MDKKCFKKMIMFCGNVYVEQKEKVEKFCKQFVCNFSSTWNRMINGAICKLNF
jgi:hypothetical protein